MLLGQMTTLVSKHKHNLSLSLALSLIYNTLTAVAVKSLSLSRSRARALSLSYTTHWQVLMLLGQTMALVSTIMFLVAGDQKNKKLICFIHYILPNICFVSDVSIKVSN
jgi:EamA domain-containing membrane protein RarD